MLLRLLMPCIFFVLCGLISLQVKAKSDIIIILDDLGYRPSDIAAFSLPKEITFSILPQTPLASRIANRAEQEGRAVMLHMPMQAQRGNYMGPLGLTTDMFADAITYNLRKAMESVPNAVGVNNHMGSAFTEQQKGMEVLLEEVKRQGLFFVDSRTTVLSRGEEIAERLGVPSASRQVFLDHKLDPAFLLQQFNLMKRIAKRNGHVVVIGHPHPETVDFLKVHLPSLEKEGLTLTSVAEYFSHAPKVAKQFGKKQEQTAWLNNADVKDRKVNMTEENALKSSELSHAFAEKGVAERLDTAPNE